MGKEEEEETTITEDIEKKEEEEEEEEEEEVEEEEEEEVLEAEAEEEGVQEGVVPEELQEEYVPIVSEDCADTVGLIEVAESGDKLNCREIRKTKICDREYDGKYLYESCQKSCEICLEPIPTTDAPTADLVELVITDSPTEAAYKSF